MKGTSVAGTSEATSAGVPVRIERESLLVHVDGDTSVAELERQLGLQGLTLAVSPLPEPNVSVTAWLAQGAPGSRSFWEDPADHLVAGFSAETPAGVALQMRAAPRRSVGPDFFALGFGTGESGIRFLRVALRIHVKESLGALPSASSPPRDLPVTATEAALFRSIEGALNSLKQ